MTSTMSIEAQGTARREWLAILLATLVGAGLRIWGLDRIGLSHFDEGIYAIAGLWSVVPGGASAYPASSIAYAPPGFPISIGISYLVFGVSDLAAVAVSILAGTLTIPTLGWLGRRSFGPGAGAAAASLGAISGAHVAFSRMALTDASFLFAWLIALGLGGRFLERQSLGRAVALGLSVGLAQHFKYNGWLSGVIVTLAALPGLRGRKEAARGLGFLAIAGAIAAVSYVPWYRFVEAQAGGYSALLKHQSSYTKGLDSWLPHFKAQLDQATALSGGPGWGFAAWALGAIGLAWSLAGLRLPIRLVLIALATLVLGGLALGLLPNLPWWISIACLPWLLRDSRPGARVIAFSMLGLTIMTPFYHPYARLWLPSTAASWLVLGGLSASFCRAIQEQGAARAGLRSNRVAIAAGLGVLAALGSSIAIPGRAVPHDRLLGPSDAIRSDLAEAHRLLGDAPGRVALLGRPPIAFYGMLRGLAMDRLQSASDLGTPRSAFAIVEESQLRQEGESSVLLEKIRTRWEVLAEFEVAGSVPSILDEDPAAAFDRSGGARSRLWLLRPRSREILR